MGSRKAKVLDAMEKNGANTTDNSNDAATVIVPHPHLPKMLQNQRALVTGANSGIGKSSAIALGEAGADVVVNYFTDSDAADDVVSILRKSGVRAYAHFADVSKEDHVISMFQRMEQEFGTIDILVNNAGLEQDAPFDEISIEQWNNVISVNLTGQFLCAREA